jgi:hypothetical protein
MSTSGPDSGGPPARIALWLALDLDPLEAQCAPSSPDADAVHRNLQTSWQEIESILLWSSPPHEKSMTCMHRERPRIGMRDRPKQVVDLPCWPSPIDLAVFWRPSTVVGRLALILRHPRRAPVAEARVDFAEQRPSLIRRPAMEGQRRVVLADGKPPLRDDIAPVGLLHHVVQRHAGLRLTVHEDPIEGRPATVLGQRRRMKIQRSTTRDLEQLAGQQCPIRE